MLKISAKVYNKALELGYPEVFIEVEGITIAANDHVEEIEDWLRKEKSLVCRVHPVMIEVYKPEVRWIGLGSSRIIKPEGSERNGVREYENARETAIEMALKHLNKSYKFKL